MEFINKVHYLKKLNFCFKVSIFEKFKFKKLITSMKRGETRDNGIVDSGHVVSPQSYSRRQSISGELPETGEYL